MSSISETISLWVMLALTFLFLGCYGCASTFGGLAYMVPVLRPALCLVPLFCYAVPYVILARKDK